MRFAPAVVLLVPVLLVGVGFWPGHLSADSLAQIDFAKSGDLTNQHAPLLVALWRPFLSLGAGPGWVLTGQLLVFVASCHLILRAALAPLPAAIATAAIALFPPVFGMLGYVGRDTWFAVLLLATFAATVRATQAAPPARRWWIAGALVFAWLTLASRQNAAAAVVLALIVIAALVLDGRATGRRRLVVATAAGVGVTLALMATQVGAQAALGVRDVNPEQYLYVYDLAALSEQDRENHFPPVAMPQRGMGPVDRFWHVDTMNGYVFGAAPPVPAPMSDAQLSATRDAWLDELTGDPLGYLEMRTELFLRQISITREAMWVYHPGIDPNPYGYVVRFPGANDAATSYVEAFADAELDGGPLYTIWVYLVLAAVCAAVLLRGSRPLPVLAVGALGLSILTYQAGLYVAAMGTQYRFEFPAVVIGLLAAVIAIKIAFATMRSRRSLAAA